VDATAASAYAGQQNWQATQVAYAGEAKRQANAASIVSGTTEAAGAAQQAAGGLMGSFGQKFGSMLGTAQKAAPKSEAEQTAEELALGPEIAGRVLGARPLWNDANAQQRVNVVGRWVASQTTRSDLPWTFGIIEDPEVNAFAAPGGYILVTHGLYELLSSDSELAAVLGHEISHCVERDQYNVIQKQNLATMGKDAVSGKVVTDGSAAQNYARDYGEQHGAARNPRAWRRCTRRIRDSTCASIASIIAATPASNRISFARKSARAPSGLTESRRTLLDERLERFFRVGVRHHLRVPISLDADVRFEIHLFRVEEVALHRRERMR
jgi:hypothetical protein